MPGSRRESGRATEGDPVLQVVELRTELAATARERDTLSERLQTGEQQLAELRQQHHGQAEELGRLRGLEATIEALTSERDAHRQRLAELQEQLPTQIEQQVAGRLEEVGKAYAAELTALRAERDRLSDRVSELEQPDDDTAPAMTTAAFAEHFASVLNDVAEPPARAGSAFTASVTGFSVSAKGLLRATDSGGIELVTPRPGKVASEALSTLNLDVKLLPRLPGGAQPPS